MVTTAIPQSAIYPSGRPLISHQLWQARKLGQIGMLAGGQKPLGNWSARADFSGWKELVRPERQDGRRERLSDTSNDSAVGSTGIGRKSDEPVSEALGELMKGLAFSAGTAADLAVVEGQGQV